MKIKSLFILLALVLTIVSVQPAAASMIAMPSGSASPLVPSPTPAIGGEAGPDLEQFPYGVSPLTGLPVADPENLELPAVLVSLANFPPSARPITGLSFAAQVYEIYITEGMTRFLSVFYGDLPQASQLTAGSPGSPTATPPASGGSAGGSSAAIGAVEDPVGGLEGVRSGREAYVPIVNAFTNSCLVAASKSSAVYVKICRNVYGSDAGNINSAGLTFDQLKDLAEANQNPLSPVNYSGNVFNSETPDGGLAANQINVFYSWLNQAQWIYDPAAQTYLRYEDFGTAEKVGQFQPAIDRLTGVQVDFENVVILFVEHNARRPTIINLDMGMGTQGRATVFRDGQIYSGLKWSMLNEAYELTSGLARPIRLKNADGTPFELAPGHTWFHVATTYSAVWQTDVKAGIWKYRFYAPGGAK